MNAQQREGARHAALRSANVALKHAGIMLYSEGPDRWSGIAERKRSWYGQYPPAADCSSFAHWVVWDATRFVNLPDVMSDLGWKAGNTTSAIAHGEVLDAPALVADMVFYGASVDDTEHMAVYIGGGRVISHGSAGGPRLEVYNYRPDIVGYRRYILP